LGDETPLTATPAPNGQAATNEDLLAEIFGGSSSPSSSTVSSPTQAQKSTVDDILGLFGSSAPTTVSSPTQTLPTNTPSAFSLPQTQSQQPPAAPRLTPYSAYDKNELKVTLTPQTVAGRPGVVNILARFQTAGGSAVTGLNFQAAVPKVAFRLSGIEYYVDVIPIIPIVTAIANAPHVKPRREPRRCRDTADASGRTCGGKLSYAALLGFCI
jgi:hypothetical protein